jgi:hypothetical protein
MLHVWVFGDGGGLAHMRTAMTARFGRLAHAREIPPVDGPVRILRLSAAQRSLDGRLRSATKRGET